MPDYKFNVGDTVCHKSGDVPLEVLLRRESDEGIEYFVKSSQGGSRRWFPESHLREYAPVPDTGEEASNV